MRLVTALSWAGVLFVVNLLVFRGALRLFHRHPPTTSAELDPCRDEEGFSVFAKSRLRVITLMNKTAHENKACRVACKYDTSLPFDNVRIQNETRPRHNTTAAQSTILFHLSEDEWGKRSLGRSASDATQFTTLAGVHMRNEVAQHAGRQT